MGNSTHVIDLAFYLGGKPKEITTFTQGSLKRHPSASIFSGAGISDRGALFNYAANWESAGRWGVEILTSRHKYILSPMEKLQVQKRGSIQLSFVEDIDYQKDEGYKPGLYLQTESFLSGNINKLKTISEQKNDYEIYAKIGNYK